MCKSTSGFRAKHSGVSNPSLFLSFRGVRCVFKATFVLGFRAPEMRMTAQGVFSFIHCCP